MNKITHVKKITFNEENIAVTEEQMRFKQLVEWLHNGISGSELQRVVWNIIPILPWVQPMGHENEPTYVAVKRDDELLFRRLIRYTEKGFNDIVIQEINMARDYGTECERDRISQLSWWKRLTNNLE